MPGTITDAIYQSDDYKNYYRVRVAVDTLSLRISQGVNFGAGGNFRDHPYMRTKGSRRSPVPLSRRVKIRFTGAVPPGYVAGTVLVLPWLLAFPYSMMTLGMEGEYKGRPIVLLDKLDEDLN